MIRTPNRNLTVYSDEEINAIKEDAYQRGFEAGKQSISSAPPTTKAKAKMKAPNGDTVEYRATATEGKPADDE